MKLDGGAIEYLLLQEFDEVTASNIPRHAMFDYPVLYDETPNMNGHTVLVPEQERPCARPDIQNVLYVCLGKESARTARESALPVLYVEGVSFRRLYNYMQRVFVRNERLEARLHAYVDGYMGFQPLLEACAQEMGCSFALIDRHYSHVAHASFTGDSSASGANADDNPFDAQVLESEAVDLFMASRGYRYMRVSHNVFTMPGTSDLLMKNLFSGGELVGTLIARHDGTMHSARYVKFLLNYLCAYAEEMYAQVGSFGLLSTGANRIRAALETAALGDRTALTSLETLLVSDGHAPQATYLLLRIERSFTNEGPEDRSYLARRFEQTWPRAYCFTANNALFMLADIGEKAAAPERDFLHELPIVARDNLCKIGMSRPFAVQGHFDEALAQSSIALEHGSRTDPTSWSYRFDDYALYWLIERLRGDERSPYACHPAIRTLAEYDNGHNSELLKTLRAFMDCRYNATDASKELYVARSTLLNRLERIQELTNINLDDAEERLHLALSFALFG